ncbi:hypothetical protein [Fidelibacter multiformis]|uniref:hypothetical protein n=1 Tax=Fidelibacter multiformis TaxID=3377529 RepID=UPI0037DBF8AD
MKNRLFRTLFLLWIPCILSAQTGTLVHIPVREYTAGETLTFQCLFSGNISHVDGVVVFIRPAGNRAYHQYPMKYNGIEWTVTIPGTALSGGDMEYFILAELSHGGVISTPDDNPFDYPLTIRDMETGKASVPEHTTSPEEGGIPAEYIILAPEPGGTIESGDFVVAVSLFNMPDIDLSSIRLELNDTDYSSYLEKSPDIITLTLPPGTLEPGMYTATLYAQNHYGTRFSPETWTFTLISAQESMQRIDRSLSGQVGTEFRWEDVDGEPNNLLRFTGRITGSIQGITLGLSGLWVSNESRRYQPRNSFNAYARTSYTDLELGTFYPELSRLTLYGNRVNGAMIRLKLNFLNLTYLRGELLREVLNRAELDSSSHTWTISSFTYARDIQVIQPEIRFGSFLNWKMTLMHARDDTASLDPALNIEDYNPETDSYIFQGNSPVDNLVFDNSITLSLDNQRLVWSHNVALSMTNRNIRGGVHDSITIGDEIISISDKLPDFMSPDRLSRFFIINENTNLPIPAEVSEDLTEFRLQPNKIMDYPSLAYWTTLRLNYYNNLVTWTFKHIAPEFSSLAYPGLQTDIHLSEIGDRIRLFRNRLIVTLRYSSQYDNLLGQQKEYVTNTNSISAAMSVMPGQELPTVSMSFRYYLRENDLNTAADTLSELLTSAATDQRIRNENLYQMFTLTQPLKTGGIPTDLTINYIRTLRKDKIPNRPPGYISPDYSLNLWSASALTRWSSTLIQTLSWSLMDNKISRTSDFTYQTFVGKIEKSLWENKLFGAFEIKWTHASGDVAFDQYQVSPELRIKIFENDLFLNLHINKLNQSGTTGTSTRFYTKYTYQF